jgi:hypothetical protein
MAKLMAEVLSLSTDNGNKTTVRNASGRTKDTNRLTFDTGGYTGEWDSSGRLAVLHQKEIVLNAHDTENFL